MAGLILFTKGIWAAGLKIVSSHPSGVSNMVYVSIFTKEMTLKKSCLLSALVFLWGNIPPQFCRNQKGENKQKQLEVTSEANSKTNSLRNILFLIIPTGFLSGVGLEREKGFTFYNSKLCIFEI